ncbi:hypothetical protein ACVWXO_003389 [Bradyrhizobium sp. LM2.7]
MIDIDLAFASLTASIAPESPKRALWAAGSSENEVPFGISGCATKRSRSIAEMDQIKIAAANVNSQPARPAIFGFALIMPIGPILVAAQTRPMPNRLRRGYVCSPTMSGRERTVLAIIA